MTGGAPLPCWNTEDCGEVLADLVPEFAEWERPGERPALAILGRGCPNCGDYAFDQPGARALGVLVADWNAATGRYDDLAAAKVSGETFDLRSPSAATAPGADGKVDRFWTFGGIDATGSISAALWVGRRTSGIGNDGAAFSYFALRRVSVEPNVAWPTARTGAALAFRGGSGFLWDVARRTRNEATGGAVAGGGPLVVPAGDGNVEGLLLVGGDSGSGLLADVWVFDGTWREVGSLPGVHGGLADAGGLVTDDAVWLFGGRQENGPSADLWRIDRQDGAAERVAAAASPWPPSRVSPAMARQPGSDSLLVFGGLDGAGRGRTDLWAYDVAGGYWRELSAGCAGDACPRLTGREKLVPATDGLAVVADPYGPGAGVGAWRLRDGNWTTELERIGLSVTRDCDRDGATEATWGARCGAGGAGFPAAGRLGCEAGAVSCRAPALPGALLRENVLPGNAAVALRRGQLAALNGGRLDSYRIANDGTLAPAGTLRLRRAGEDLALVGDYALVADRRGLTAYSMLDGREAASVPTCGKARRVFVVGGTAYVLGLRSLLVLDVADPAAPRVVREYRLVAFPGSAWLTEAHGCSVFYDVADLLYDLFGFCAGWARLPAAEDGNRLFVSVLDGTYVIDFGAGPEPVLRGPLPTGAVRDLRAEKEFLYVNGLDGRTALYAQHGDVWSAVGGHDVRDWADGVVEEGRYTVWRRPGELLVGTSQSVGP